MSEASGPAGPTALRGDCARCAGLCCVVPAFSRSADFAIDKPAGQPCRHLGPDFRCGIHADLRGRGFRGCAVYDCFGAGQQVCQVTFGGQDWTDPATAAQIQAVFPVMRQLHELLWYLTAALSLPEAGPVQAELRQARQEIGGLTRLEAPVLLSLDLAGHWQRASALLRRASQLARAGVEGADHAGADLAGARLRGADLTGASLRGATAHRRRPALGQPAAGRPDRRRPARRRPVRRRPGGEPVRDPGPARRGPRRRGHPAAAAAAPPGALARDDFTQPGASYPA